MLGDKIHAYWLKWLLHIGMNLGEMWAAALVLPRRLTQTTLKFLDPDISK